MKKFFKITGIFILSVLFVLYLAFLFVLPNQIDLNKYKPDLQKLVKENTDLTVDFDNVKVITSPLLEAGVKVKNIKVKLPDESVLFSADSFKGKVFLPELLWLTVRVSCAEVEKPNMNVEIINSNKYKVAKVYEDLVNKKREQRRLNPPEALSEQENQIPFDISSIKLIIPALTLNNYNVTIDDVNASHKLTLKGDDIELGYFNGEKASLKTNSKLLSDDQTNITADLDIKTFLPKFNPQPQDDDDDTVFELPFVNPVSEFRNYDLKSKISSKIKIKKNKKTGRIWAKGFVNIDDTNVKLSGLQLPDSYFRFNANGHVASVDTNLYVTDSENIQFLGNFGFGHAPFVDCSLKSTKVHFANLLNIARAYLDTIHIRNDINNMTANGYLYSNFKFKTDFDNIESDGKFIIRDGQINDNNIGLLFNNMNANFLFDDNKLNVEKTHLLVNNHPLEISGEIDSHSNTKLNVIADRLPLRGLYLAFAPKEVKQAYKLNSGDLSLDAKVRGTIKNSMAIVKADLADLQATDSAQKFVMTNKNARFGLANSNGEIKGKFKNEGFKILLPDTKSEISDDLIVANIDNKNINVENSIVKVNNNSKISFVGNVKNYLTGADTKFTASGSLSAKDIENFLGDSVAPYFDSKGSIPVKARFQANGQRMKLVSQLQTNMDDYITPVKIAELEGRPVLFQLMAEKNRNIAKIYRSGLFLRKNGAEFRDKLHTNMIGAKEIVGLRAVLINLDTNPFISLFKLNLQKNLNGSICLFPQSKFVLGGNIYAYGNLNNPKINGNFDIRNLSIPEIYTTVRNIATTINGRGLNVAISDVNANESDFAVKIQSSWKQISQMKLADVKVHSKSIDVDKLLKVSDALMASLPKTEASGGANSNPADIPVEIMGGNINLRKIKTGNILVNNTTGKISLYKNVFYLNKLKTSPLGGKVTGDVAMNLITTELNAKLTGKDFDINKMLVDAMNMKDTLSGEMKFITDITMKGYSVEEQMKTLKGFLDFEVQNGQLGPFGKFENFLMAENIRNNAFFSSAIGSVIKKIVTFDTSRFNKLYGHLTFADGFADISPIKSQGNVMSMYIAGKVGLLDNSADLKVRGKLASAFSDSLGPLANINPINLVKNTPGLNIVLAKTFSIFCQAVSEEEMKAIPELAANKSDDYATKFQIVLRGDTRKPLKMIKSFKWLALNSEIEAAQNFVDTIPMPEEGEENLSVEELIQKRAEAAAEAKEQAQLQIEEETQNQTFKAKFKNFFKRSKKDK